MLKEKNTSQLFKQMSIKLCRQQVVFHRAFDQRSRWRATARDCRIRQVRLALASFLTYVGMTSEPGGALSDTFLTAMHLALITGDRFCAEFAHLKQAYSFWCLWTCALCQFNFVQ